MKLQDIEFNTSNLIKIFDSCASLSKSETLEEYEIEEVTYESIVYLDPGNGVYYDIVSELECLVVTFEGMSKDSDFFVQFEDKDSIIRILMGCLQRNKIYLENFAEHEKRVYDILGI